MLSTLITFITAWYNLPFTFLLALCLLLAALQWIGLGGDHNADGDLDGELDSGLEAGDGPNLDQDLDADGDAEVEPDAAGEAQPGFSILAYLGVGRAPLLVTLLLWFGSTGLAGWVFNGLVLQVTPSYPAPLIGAAFLLALAAGSLVSSRIARAIGRALPPISTTATPAQAIVGRRGTVISPYVDQRYGMVHLRDAAGTLISVFAVTAEDAPIRRGEQVVCVSYDAHQRLYRVVRAPESFETGLFRA